MESQCISIELALSCACAWPGLSLWRLPVPQPTICVRRPSTLHLCTSSRSERKSNSSNGLWRPRDWRPRDWRPRDWRRRPRFGYDCPLLDGHRMAACVCVLCGASLYAVCLSFVFGPAHTTLHLHLSIAKDRSSDHGRGTCEAEGERTALRMRPHRSPAQVLGRVARVPVRRVASGVGEACALLVSLRGLPPPARSCTAVPESGSRGEAGAAESHLNESRDL
jgi:hypothetical protein